VEAIHRGGDVGGDDRNNTSFNRTKADTSHTVTSQPSRWCRWRSEKHVCAVLDTWLYIENSAFVITPRSRTMVTGWTSIEPIRMLLLAGEILLSLAAKPNHITSVLSAFSWRCLAAHQARTSVVQSASVETIFDTSVSKPCFKPCMSSANRWYCSHAKRGQHPQHTPETSLEQDGSFRKFKLQSNNTRFARTNSSNLTAIT